MVKEKKETETVKQETLFGDQDFVYNVLQTRQSDLGFEIKRHEEAIDRKKESIQQLEKDKKETEKAIEIVKKQRKGMTFPSQQKGKDEVEAGVILSTKEPGGKEAPF